MTERTQPKDTSVTFGSNHVLDDIVKAIQELPLDEGKLVGNLFRIPFFKHGYQKTFSEKSEENRASRLGSLRGFAFEIAVLSTFEAIEGLNGGVVINPIEDATETEGYVFSVKLGGRPDPTTHVDKKAEGGLMSHTEYDLLTEVRADGVESLPLPVVWEVKTGKWKENENTVMQPEHIANIFSPLREYYGPQGIERFGYVVVAPARDRETISPYMEKFMARGGVFVESSWDLFHLPREQFFKRLQEAL